MKLTDLNAVLIKRIDEKIDREVSTLTEADGVMFQCPKCAVGCEPFVDDDGKRGFRGAHYVICWFVGKVPDDVDPKPGRWTPQGTGLDDLTFVPGNPPQAVSVLLTGEGCGWHGFIRNGDAA
jgi:hypothetical protein